MLIFFYSQADAESFATQHKCAVYHSNLWEAGNTKAYNLDLWDRGESKIMACTTAFAQGIDRSNVRFVVIFRPAYGLIVNNQMMGRAGQDGKESHVFFVTDENAIVTFRGVRAGQESCLEELHDVVHGEECRRYSTMVCMDGIDFATRCTEQPGSIPCDVCSPNSPMQRFAMQAIQAPLEPISAKGSSSNNHANVLQTAPLAFVQASVLHQSFKAIIEPAPAPAPAPATEPVQPSSQGSSEMYDDSNSQITSSQAMVLDAMEVIHKPRASRSENDNPFMV
ncbi:hypothetical protein BDR06DRAFT_1005383 [Suillus hirtellus]|nr:hypothetical protein BDR06DRAFT_1005383 [Suillus hirtellus]